ncbi:MAG: hypothetical protein IPO82_18645 [Betaproteobacteria bacterium]|nr:hypothetical protein [Betaproteobacteria bacterium]
MGEQAAVILPAGIDELVVDVGELGRADGEPRRPRHPGLDAGVGHLVVLDLGRRLDLDQPAGAGLPDQDVGADQDVARLQRRLEQRHVAGPGEQGLGLAQRGGEVVDVPDEVPAREQRLRSGADAVALGHPIRRGFRRCGELRTVLLQPQPLGTLQPGDEAGFGQAHGGLVPMWTRALWPIALAHPRADSR